MKSFVYLVAVVCAVSVTSVASTFTKREDYTIMYPENEEGPFKTHEEIVADLSAKELSPAEVAYLLSSLGKENGRGYIIPLWRDYHLLEFNGFYPYICRNEMLTERKEQCELLAKHVNEANEKTAEKVNETLGKNLVNYCEGANKELFEYCADKMESDI